MMYEAEFMERLQTALRSALPAWGMASDASLKLLSISENATYLARDAASGAALVLRMQRPHYHSDAEIRAELDWIAALRSSGLVHTAEPISTKDGQWIHKVEDGDITHRITAFSFVSGSEPQLGDDLSDWYCILGAITARLHQHARSWVKPEGFERKHWCFETLLGSTPHWGNWRQGPGLDAADIALLEQVQALIERRCQAYGQSPERYGLVHCDMRAANLLVDGETLYVVDFDDCGFSWYLYDFAACISFIEHEPCIPQLQAAWLEGYQSVSRLDAEDIAMLPYFVMMRRMQLTAWIASHAETPTAQGLGVPYAKGTVALGRQFLASLAEQAA